VSRGWNHRGTRGMPLTLLLLGAIVSACGSGSQAKTPSRPLAVVAHQSISRSELHRMSDYSLRFYAALYPDTGAHRARTCLTGSRAPVCVRLREQVLARLIEEHTVLAWASTHHVTLTQTDRAQANSELARMRADNSPTAGLFTNHHVGVRFMRSVLQRQLLIQKVRAAVTSHAVVAGPAYHIQKYLVHGEGKDRRAAAEHLATQGRPIPPDTSTALQWQAPFRLATGMVQALDEATPGDFVGPFSTKSGFVVYRLLSRGVHQYGRPAREQLQARYFHSWLTEQLQKSPPKCFNSSDNRVPCPATLD
jgi:hypothetical protein